MMIHNLLHSIRILSDTCISFSEKCIDGLEANEEKISQHLENSLMLVTALNPHIGYDNAAKIAKKAFAENRPLKAVALEMCDLSDEELDKALDPSKMTRGGFVD